MAELICQVSVNNTPVETEEFIVARFDTHTRKLWFYGTWNDEKKANDVAAEVDGIVVRKLPDV